jgi:hypothetical protein
MIRQSVTGVCSVKASFHKPSEHPQLYEEVLKDTECIGEKSSFDDEYVYNYKAEAVDAWFDFGNATDLLVIEDVGMHIMHHAFIDPIAVLSPHNLWESSYDLDIIDYLYLVFLLQNLFFILQKE